MQLRDDHPLGTVDDEGAGLGHERNFAHVNFLLLNVLDGALRSRALLVVEHEMQLHAQRGRVSHTPQLALLDVKYRSAQPVAHVLEGGVPGVALDGKNRFECRIKAFVLTRFRLHSRLEEFAIGIDLNGQQERRVQNTGPLAEVLANAFSLSEGITHG